MKKILFALLVFFSSSVFAQDFPEVGTDISPLLIGESIPKAILKSVDGKTVFLSDLIKQKPTVLLFFRGGWCPYCNAQLVDLRKSVDEIAALGYQLIAVSPDSFEKTSENLSKNKLNFTLLSDVNREAMIGFGIAYKAPENYKKIVTTHSNGTNTDLIPVPSVFVVDKAGLIQFEYINPDFKTRISSSLLLSVLKALN